MVFKQTQNGKLVPRQRGPGLQGSDFDRTRTGLTPQLKDVSVTRLRGICAAESSSLGASGSSEA